MINQLDFEMIMVEMVIAKTAVAVVHHSFFKNALFHYGCPKVVQQNVNCDFWTWLRNWSKLTIIKKLSQVSKWVTLIARLNLFLHFLVYKEKK